MGNTIEEWLVDAVLYDQEKGLSGDDFLWSVEDKFWLDCWQRGVSPAVAVDSLFGGVN